MRLQNKTAIITGAGYGIGLAIAKMFIKEEANVCAGVHKEEDIEMLSRELPNALVVKMNVAENKNVENAVAKCVEKFGTADILVNNAGVYKGASFHEMPEEDWDFVMDVDLKGVYRCAKAVIPHMLKKEKGKIINIASIAGLIGFAGSSAYCAAKGAIVNLTRDLALKYAAKKINVNCICPGVIRTKMTESFLNDPKMAVELKSAIPWPRIGEPEDVAYLAVYLASDESDFMTGAIIPIDGGEIAQ